MTFKEYIRARGIQACANDWRVSRVTIYNWLNGKSWPTKTNVERIMKTTKFKPEHIYWP